MAPPSPDQVVRKSTYVLTPAPPRSPTNPPPQLERVYRRPRYLATCIFAVQFVLFAISTAGSISFSSYMILANDPDNRTPDAWVIRGVAITALTGVCLIHAFTPRLGIWLSNGLGAFKLVLLSLVVFTGFAALAGRMEKPSPGNFKSFHGEGTLRDDKGNSPAGAAAGYALALLQVLYAYSGWENANYVLTEVRNAPTTLKRAAPIAVSIVTVLYVLANIAYVSWSSGMEVEVRGAMADSVLSLRP